jgi:DNA-binding transcriptional LysR family regulator
LLIVNDLRFFRYMITLTEFGHFARAARALGISQPALSLGIKRLERELGARLFDRVRGRVSPTPFGEVAIRRAREMVDGGEELAREISLLKGLQSGSLVVATGTFAAEISGHRALGRIMKRYPSLQCRLELREWNRCTEMLLTRQADIALAELTVAANEPLLVSELINTHVGKFYCRSGHPLLSIAKPDMKELSSYPWVLVPLPPRVYHSLKDVQPAAGRLDEELQQFIPAVRVETVGGMKQVVAHSDAMSAAPLALIEPEINSGILAPIEFEAPWLRLNYGFVYLRDRMLSPAARAFMSEVRLIEDQFAVDLKTVKRSNRPVHSQRRAQQRRPTA